jgi:hypothetical protein
MFTINIHHTIRAFFQMRGWQNAQIDDDSRRNAVEDPAVVLGGFHHGPNIWKTHAVSSSSSQLSGHRLLAPTFRCCSALPADSAFVTLVYRFSPFPGADSILPLSFRPSDINEAHQLSPWIWSNPADTIPTFRSHLVEKKE